LTRLTTPPSRRFSGEIIDLLNYVEGYIVLISLARGALFREYPSGTLVNQGFRREKVTTAHQSTIHFVIISLHHPEKRSKLAFLAQFRHGNTNVVCKNFKLTPGHADRTP
jgi:hypothetical protein